MMEPPQSQGELEGILSEAGVDPSISAHLLGAGWTRQSFAVCALSLSDLDNHWDELLGGSSELSLQQKACIRVARQTCQQAANPPQVAVPSGSSQAPSSVSGGWSETFAPKISSAAIASLKPQFLKDYPSEVITGDTMPSTRLSS